MSETNLEKVLILDDSPDYRKLIKTFINKLLPGIETIEYDPVFEGVPDDGFDWAQYDVLLLDYHLSIVGVTGLDILQKNHKKPEFPATIMLTGAGTEEIAVRALKTGIYEYQPKQSLTKDKLKQSIIHAWESKKADRKKQLEITNHNRAFNKEVFYEQLAMATGSDELQRVLVVIKPDAADQVEKSIGLIGRDNLINYVGKQCFEIFKLGACNPNITRISDDAIAVQIDFPGTIETLQFNMQGLCKHLSKSVFKFSDEKYAYSVSIGVLILKDLKADASALIEMAMTAVNQASKIDGNSYAIFQPETTPSTQNDQQQHIDETLLQEKKMIEQEVQSARDEKQRLEKELAEASARQANIEASLKNEQQEAQKKLQQQLDEIAQLKQQAEAELHAANETKLNAEREAKRLAEEELRQQQNQQQAAQQAEKIAKQKLEAELKAKSEMEARLRAESEAREKEEAQKKAEQEARQRQEAELKAEAEAKAKAELEARAEQETKQRQEAELRAEAEAKAKAELEARAEQETKQRQEAELRADAEAEAKIELEARAEQEAKQRREAELRAEAEAKAKAELELEMEKARQAREKLEAELKAISEAKEKAEAEMKAVQQAKAEIEQEIEQVREESQLASSADTTNQPAATDESQQQETNTDIPEANDEQTETEQAADQEQEENNGRDLENVIAALLKENKLVQTYQPIIAMFEDEQQESNEIYQTGLFAYDEPEDINESLLNISGLSLSLQQSINQWALRQIFARITESGTEKTPLRFIFNLTECWFSDITLFQWLQKILTQTKKYSPGKAIIVSTPLDLYLKHQKRATALLNTLHKTYLFKIAITGIDSVEDIEEHCHTMLSKLLIMDITQLNSLNETLSAKTKVNDDDEQENMSLLQSLKSGGIQIITTDIEDATILTDAISAGTDYALGSFVGEVQDNLTDMSNLESMELV